VSTIASAAASSFPISSSTYIGIGNQSLSVCTTNVTLSDYNVKAHTDNNNHS